MSYLNKGFFNIARNLRKLSSCEHIRIYSTVTAQKEVQFYSHLFNFRGLSSSITVKFLNFGMPEKFAVIPKIHTKRPKLRVFNQEDANGIANSEDPDQTAPLGVV